jgi:hypothetical protein
VDHGGATVKPPRVVGNRVEPPRVLEAQGQQSANAATPTAAEPDAATLTVAKVSSVVDLSKLAELATLAGHSREVWRGVFSAVFLV